MDPQTREDHRSWSIEMAIDIHSVTPAAWLLEQEARAMLTRLTRVKPFALQETMVAAASVPLSAQRAIEGHLLSGRARIRRMILDFIRWLRTREGRMTAPAMVQRRFTMLRLRFNASLTQFDIFADALTQRSENETGVWLSGLDAAADDALRLRRPFYEVPPLVCYLDRGHGAAIRRARTRLPGGDENPVAIIRVPRERMIGSGVASSLFHEVGHQADALLDLAASIRPILRGLQQTKGPERVAWKYWDRCISEILADFWSVARLGITATLGLMAVVSLPKYFVFRLSLDDPHPVPWIRVKLSCAMGRALYPHSQWDDFERLWETLYPANWLQTEKKEQLDLLSRSMPGLASLITNFRPKKLLGASISEALEVDKRRPEILLRHFDLWRGSPIRMRRAPPSLVFAVIGQARADGRISPEDESRLLTSMLKHWALKNTLNYPSADY
jgi:hypothetical protein